MNAEQLTNVGVAEAKANRLEEAERWFRAAIAADANHRRAYLNLSLALQLQSKLAEALDAADRAIALGPEHANGYQSRGVVLMNLNRLPEAIESFRRAMQIEPDEPETHGLIARALLITGEFKRGWAEYEWRWKCGSYNDTVRQFTQPRWNGARAEGKTILLYHEQGYGDTIQFIRYAPLAAERCGRLIVQVPPDMMALVRRMPGIDQVVPLGGTLPYFDLQAALMSMPLVFNTTPKTVPAKVPYLLGSGAAADAWKARMQDDGAKLRVGLAWAGRPTHPNDRRRSIPLNDLAALGGVGGVVFYSLQKPDPARPFADPPPPAELRMIDQTDRLKDFTDTAALIYNLDLVISVDTAVVHLAGAMAKPVWTLLPFAPDFRWMLDRPDTPWYPTMTLLRQSHPGDWSETIAQAAEKLKDFAASHAR